jgi:hypothetical protein
VWQARADQIADDTERIAAEVAALETRLRAAAVAVTGLIGGATAREDRTMKAHLGAARARSRDTSLTLRRAAATVRRLGTDATVRRLGTGRGPGTDATGRPGRNAAVRRPGTEV